MNVLLSIIIAVHNNEGTLMKCIDSFYDKVKDNSKIEVICINDHSMDESLNIIKQYEKIKIFNSPKHGLGPSRNCGIEHANAKYIWFIDADDELCIESIDNKFIALLESSNSDLFLLGVEKISENKNVYLVNKNSGNYQFNENSVDIKNLFLDNIFNNSWNKLYRKKVINTNNLKFDEVSSVEDILFNCKFLTVVNEVTVINKVFYKYYIYSKTSTKWSWQSDKLDVSVDMIEKINKLRKDNYSINRKLVSLIATDALIGNEINNFISSQESQMNFGTYKDMFNMQQMKFIRKYSSIFNSKNLSYFIKSCIANSAILSYLYVKKMISKR